MAYVLVVDDSLTYREKVAEELTAEGFDVQRAESGERALELLGRLPVDCVLLDMVMPGLSGEDTCRHIREDPMLRGIPIILLTAREEPEALIGGLSAGADDYVTKSDRFEVLKARLRAQLRRKHFEDENDRFRQEVADKNSELEKANAELARSNEDLEQFAYVASHDLKEPLRKIKSFGNKLQRRLADRLDEEDADALERMQNAADRMTALILDLLALAHVTTNAEPFAPVDLDGILAEVLVDLDAAISRAEARLKVGDLPTVEADSTQIRQLLQNLISNALKFRRDGVQHYVEVSAHTQGETCEISVKDNGVGFEPDQAAGIFKAFKRLHGRKFEGTGVGMAIVKKIVDRHGGRIVAEGRPGEGAEFRVTLPLRHMEAAADAPGLPKAAGSTTKDL